MDNIEQRMTPATVCLRIRIPDVPNEGMPSCAVNLEDSLVELSKQIEVKYKSPDHELVYVHRGRALDKKMSLKEQGVRNSSTIYVMMRKRTDSEMETRPDQHLLLTDEKLKQITSAFKRFTASRLWELSHPRVLSRILKLYPAIRDDLGALAILRDPILLSSMKSPENFQVISKQYPIFIEAASSIADILHKLDSTKARAPEFEDSESSSSSSSSEDLTANNNNNNNENYNTRPITQQQLAEALAYVAGAAFRSSQQSTQSTESREPMELTTEQAESQDTAVSGSGNSATTTEQHPQSVEQEGSQEESRSRYTQELIQMREMGLIDEAVNLQALLICNGDLEAAINLVFSSSN